MSQYYLMAQLPALDALGDTAPLPITEEAFYDLCGRTLGKKVQKTLQELTLVPSRENSAAGSPLVDAWNLGEKRLRLALGMVRAEKMKKSFDSGDDTIPPDLLQTARTALELGDPLAAEQYLNRCRLALLDDLRPMDAFSEDAVLCYALKLKLLTRMRSFDESKGREAYRNTYDSILHGADQEKER